MFLTKLFKWMFRHKLAALIILTVIVAGGYFGFQGLLGEKNSVRYVTAAVEKGTLIVSVSGSGQLAVLDQVDIKPKVSGELAALNIKKDQEVKAGQVLAELDSQNAQKAIRDAEVSLDSAKAKLNDLLSQPDAKSLLQAENALAQAERDLAKAEENYQEIKMNAERSLATAYEDGYNVVSTNFFKLSGFLKDLKEVLGTERSTEEYISAYKLILGSESPFVQKLLHDHYQANNLFNESFAFFRGVSRNDGRDTIYQLLLDTIRATRAIAQALESARHMFDAIVVGSYKHLNIASYIDKMAPKIESDISAVYSNLSSLQRIQDTIDDTNKNTPKKIEDAKFSLQAAQEKLDEKKLALEELKAGADPQDIKSQQNIVAQKEDALLDVKEKLAECFIRAPFEGIIAEVNSKIKKGDSVSAGQVLANLITKQKIAEITLNEIDVAKVKTGQKATITFDAIDGLTLTGEVLAVDALGTVQQGVVTYNLKIGLDTQDERVKPGMSISSTVITDVKQDVLLVPNSAIKQQGDMLYVQIAKTQDGEPSVAAANIAAVVIAESNLYNQTIQVGLSNDTMAEVIEGLQEGDLVIAQVLAASSAQSQSSSVGGFGLPGVSSGGGQMRMMIGR